MGVLRGSYTWDQTADSLMLHVPLKGSSPKSVDVFAAPLYVKVNYAPYLLQLDLAEEIEYNQGMAKVVDGVLQLTFKKKKLGMWECLEITTRCPTMSKEDVKARRQLTLKVREKNVKAQKERNKTRRVEDSRFTTREQMAVDERERGELERKKEQVKAEAEKEVYEVFARLNTEEAKHTEKKKDKPAELPRSPKGTTAEESDIFTEADLGAGAGLDETITATPSDTHEALSIFPTPMRESKKEEEEDWLLRNRRHLNKRMQKKLEGVDISERDPFWLKGKGDDFFKGKDYLSAVNAYTCALEINPAYSAVLSNRAACYLQTEAYAKCIQDCTTALQLALDEYQQRTQEAEEQGLQPPKELRREIQLRKKLHIRRGTAHCCLQDYVKGLTDYQKAAEIDAADLALKEDCKRINTLVKAAALKDLGDDDYRHRQYAKALDYYTQALGTDPNYIAALSNRSACYLALDKLSQAKQDCTAALDLLGFDSTVSSTGLASGFIPTKGSEKWKRGVCKLLERRAKCHYHTNEYSNMENDLQAAFDLLPDDEELAEQLCTARLLIKKPVPSA